MMLRGIDPACVTLEDRHIVKRCELGIVQFSVVVDVILCDDVTRLLRIETPSDQLVNVDEAVVVAVELTK